MKNTNLILLLTLTLAAAKPAAAQNPSAAQPVTSQTPKPKRITVDDFTVPEAINTTCNDCPVNSGPVHTSDYFWFTNKKLRQTLVFERYTDGFHQQWYLFSNDDIPAALIDSMSIYAGTDTATRKQKQKYLPGFLAQAKPIAASYFISAKGFHIGDSIAKAVKTYGQPHARSTKNGVDILSWTWDGEDGWDGKRPLHGHPLAAHSFGQDLALCFRNNLLIGLIIHNWVP